MACSYTETTLNESDQQKLIEIFGRRKLRFSWGMNEFGTLYRQGYKWCSRCVIMIDTKDPHCPLCGRQMRSRPRVKRK